VRHLKLSQFYYLIVRRLLPSSKLKSVSAGLVRRGINAVDWLPTLQPDNLHNEFRFINETKPFNPDSVDWVCDDQKKLWRYNQHYFDFLQWDCFSDELKAKLIDSWIDSCPMNQWISWDPYAVSLRIVNWVKYFDAFPAEREIPQRWLDSLLIQACWQAHNMEYQILANHLVKNAKALVFAGAFFDGERAENLLRLGCKVMLEQVREQFMHDGGHFERSHMYHLIVTEDYLDLLNLARKTNLSLSEPELAEIRVKAAHAVDYYTDLCAGDGELQMFNDSTFGITVDTATFLAYAARVMGNPVKPLSSDLTLINKAATGYYGYRHAGDSMLIDCGAVGPDYQPGHAHCDALSYDLCVNGQRVVVDSGNFTYEHLPIRYENRQTAGHNTVRVDGEEQSEVWERWRVGRRAYPIAAELIDQGDGKLSFVGSHDGYCRLPGSVVHERRVDIDVSGLWQISDHITGRGEHLLESFVHLHPALAIVVESDSLVRIDSDAGPVARLQAESGIGIAIEDSAWCPEFGIKLDNKVLVMRTMAELPATIKYTITKL
jgi:uncharacterized heparinase superfamily protein